MKSYDNLHSFLQLFCLQPVQEVNSSLINATMLNYGIVCRFLQIDWLNYWVMIVRLCCPL